MSTYALQMLGRVGISEQFARPMLSQVKLISFDSEQIVWRRGQPVLAWTLIMDGLVVSTAPIDAEEKLPIFIYGHHTWFGEQPILNRHPSGLEYVCASPVQAMQLPMAWFTSALNTEVNFMRHIMKLVAWRAEMASETLVLMKFGSSAMRVVLGIALCGEALASHSERPPTVGLDGGLEIPINQHLLAKLCGVSRTLLSEYLQQLASSGWVLIGYGRIEILSIGTWQRMLRRLRRQSIAMGTTTIDQLLRELDHSAVV